MCFTVDRLVDFGEETARLGSVSRAFHDYRRIISPRQPSMRHTISALVENKFGVLTRIAGMFSGRGFNIDTLNVAPTHDASLSRITVVLKGDDSSLDLCISQLRKLINVVDVTDFKEGQAVSRELVLVRIKADGKTRPEIMQICDIFRAKIVNVAHKDVIIEITGDEGKVTAFLGLVEPFGILELARTGQLALKRISS
jgi:acetolactate synthase-1/3 small subunit